MTKPITFHLGIDASNIRQGGGITHLSQMLAAADPQALGVSHITVWTSRSVAALLPFRPWLTITSPPWVEAGLLYRLLGQQILLNGQLIQNGCDVLFSPGGTVPFQRSIPVVTMSQNLLPFEPREAALFGYWSPMRLKMWLLRQMQMRSFRSAEGIIFLTRYAQEIVHKWADGIKEKSVIIPHGIESRFLMIPRKLKRKEELSIKTPFKILYVSILMPYKHQIEVAYAISELRSEGYPVQARFLGGDWGRYGKKFRKTISKLDPAGEYLIWPGSVSHISLHEEYGSADGFVFASSCENLPNILIEAMAAGLPIASSNQGPMPEVLGDAGVYFDPYNQVTITKSLRKLVDDLSLREKIAINSWKRSQCYSWNNCATATITYIAAVAHRSKIFNETQKNVY